MCHTLAQKHDIHVIAEIGLNRRSGREVGVDNIQNSNSNYLLGEFLKLKNGLISK